MRRMVITAACLGGAGSHGRVRRRGRPGPKAGIKLWSLPDQAANRVAPGGLTVAWHGALYGYTNGKQPIVLDAKTGKDLSTEVGFVPDWVSKYAAAGVDQDGASKAYPVKKQPVRRRR